jgi:hypothetical protein
MVSGMEADMVVWRYGMGWIQVERRERLLWDKVLDHDEGLYTLGCRWRS